MDSVTTFCSLWKLTLKNSTTYTLTDHDDLVNYAGDIYAPQHGADGSLVESQNGFTVDSGEVRTRLDLPGLSPQSIRDGILDGAALSQFRHDWDRNETILQSKGRVGNVRLSDHVIEVEWLGQSSLLDRSTGRVFSRQCHASFGDARCGLNAAKFETGTVCQRSFAACRDQFANTVNFRGFPYLLGDDLLQAGVSTSDIRDGSSRYT